ncbi:uncharacterized protein C11orf16 homolog [Microcaecilia unicolor]|uniref:Uncharacterized protein C11orf16 homolog n=1 Tax=Microcaecilia unicolor TaxID=1415580 RepID=A0A6P7XS81_9AMPH|nr:uncharacterized protein C11orf16 homolog [Microcaecilia unicolor]
MNPSVGPQCPDEKYCSVMMELNKPPCNRLLPPYSCALTSCPLLAHHSWTRTSPIHQRCSWAGHCPYFSDVACTRFIGSAPRTSNTPVLARREPDGFYYLATIIEELEEERGVFLVEFDRPHPKGEKYQTGLQRTASDDIIQYFDAMRHCIVPGAKVLAPWEPQLTRYGPGTVVLGIEMRDPLRVIEDEEITVSFWNGKKIKVPPGVAVWIPSAVWERIVERLHLPISSRPKLKEYPQNTTAYIFNDCAPTLPFHTCHLDGLCKHRWPYCFASPYYRQLHSYCGPQRTSCFPTNIERSTLCCQPKCQHWWPLASITTKDVKDTKEFELVNKPALLSLEPKKEAEKEDLTAVSSPSSSSSLSEDCESDKETCLSKSIMVDSAVNTDSSLWEMTKINSSEQVKPDWKYWKRSCPEPNHKKPGSSVSSNCFTDKKSECSISWLDLTPVGPSNQSAMFEAITSAPTRRLTVKEVLSHNDVTLSKGAPAAPVQEKLGESQREQFKREQEAIEQQRKTKLQQREWERKREEKAEQEYTSIQEHRRKKMLQQLQKEEKKIKERAEKEDHTLKVKQLTQLRRSLQRQTMAQDDRAKEERRQAHLQHVRQKLDEKEFHKHTAEEVKERHVQEARRKRVDTHYKLLAEKLHETERQAQTKSARQRIRARVRSM